MNEMWRNLIKLYSRISIARHMSQIKPAIIKYINQEKDEEERREEMKEEIGMMTERGWKKIEHTDDSKRYMKD